MGKKRVMIMSIIDINNGQTALDNEINDIHHGDDHNHHCHDGDHSKLVGKVR